ncbi:MAG: glutaredoxin family protein [Pseudomonadota bacterium]|uniref:glutaredoxin family protein n=1 Tax=Thermithiobacillus tepidarius TaxID=929 RepID=UPI0004243CBB|nr:thioredoxin family protein [Thermithiobacillus tepidarius]
MDVQIIATKGCTHRPNLEKELRDLGIPHQVVFVEDHPEVAARYHIRHSPNLVVDGQVVFTRQPDEGELKTFFAGRT